MSSESIAKVTQNEEETELKDLNTQQIMTGVIDAKETTSLNYLSALQDDTIKLRGNNIQLSRLTGNSYPINMHYSILFYHPSAAVTRDIPLPKIDVKMRLSQYPVQDLNNALNENLPFKIPSNEAELISTYPDVFERGDWLGNYAVNMFLYADCIGTGESIYATISRDDRWFAIIQQSVSNIDILRDETSSRLSLRSNCTICRQFAICLRAVSNKSDDKLRNAELKLTKEFSPRGFCVFPEESSSIIGISTSPNYINIYIISFKGETSTYHSRQIACYKVVNDINTKVQFLVTLFKIMRWIASINGPKNKFHLVPGYRKLTNNGHYITWMSDGLLKDFNETVDIDTLNRIDEVYSKKLKHVEWGTIHRYPSAHSNGAILITRIGIPIKLAILSGFISKAQAKRDAEAGMKELHSIGYAHCDIALRNIFYDETMKCAFLNDLEYLTPLNGPPPLTNHFSNQPRNAEHLDTIQFNELVFD
jgi:hypothetical protein